MMTLMGNYGEQIERAVRAQIRAEIAAKGLKQADVARMAGIHTSTLSRLLNDEEDRPLPMKFLAEMATALGLPPHVIAERAERRIKDEEPEILVLDEEVLIQDDEEPSSIAG